MRANALLIVLAVSGYCDAAKILGVFMTPSYSHQIVYQPIWKELSLRGHDVTVITTHPLRDPSLTNLTEIDVGVSYEEWKKFGISTLGGKERSTGSNDYKRFFDAYLATADVQLRHPAVNSIIKKENNATYDILLVEYVFPLMFAFKDIYDIPMIGITSLELSPIASSKLGITRHPVVHPDVTLPFSVATTLRERVTSAVHVILARLLFAVDGAGRIDRAARKYFGYDVRGVSELMEDCDMVIMNSNTALQNVKLTAPSVVQITGMHLRPKKPLPEDLQKFLDSSNEGVVYFSLGSNVRSADLPPEKIDQLLTALSQLPYNVLWKFESDDHPNLPKNVFIRKWIPQQDVLGHKNVKLFITQGGLQSLDEAMYNKVPLLVIPFFYDQRQNADKIVKRGAGLSLNFHDFTNEELINKISDLVKNPNYKNNMQGMYDIAFDQPTSSLEKAVWWIEYVIRHKGAKHLRYAALDIPLYQYYLLDVYLLIGSILALVVYTVAKICGRIAWVYSFCKGLLSNKKSKTS